MHHSFHCGLILRHVETFVDDTIEIQPALGSIPSPGPCLDWRHKSWRVAHPIKNGRQMQKFHVSNQKLSENPAIRKHKWPKSCK